MALENDTMKLKGDHKISNKALIKHLYLFIKPELWKFALAMLLIVINVGLDIVCPLLVSKHTDVLTESLNPSSGQDVLLAKTNSVKCQLVR